MKLLKVFNLLVLFFLLTSCGENSIKTVEIVASSLPPSVNASIDSSKFVYYKNTQTNDVLSLKAVCRNSDMGVETTSPVIWSVTYDASSLPIPFYKEDGAPVFIQNNSSLNLFLSSIESLGTYTIKATSENGRSDLITLSVLSPYSLSNSILVSSPDNYQNIVANKNINLIRGKVYSFSLSNASSFGKVTWSLNGGSENDYLFSSKNNSSVNTREYSIVTNKSVNSHDNECVMLHLADNDAASPLSLTVSTPNEKHKININGIHQKIDKNLPFPTLAPYPIVNGYEVRVYMPDEAKNEDYELEISKNNGAIWNTVFVNNEGYYSENIERVSKFNIDETIYFKARIKNVASRTVGPISEIKLLLQSFPSTVMFNKTPHEIIMPSSITSDDDWENFKLTHPLFTLNASSSFEELCNVPLRDTLLSDALFSIYKTPLNDNNKEFLLQNPILDGENNFNDYSLDIPFYSSKDNSIFFGNTSLVKGYAPHSIVEEIDNYKIENIVDIEADVNIVPYVFFDKTKETAYYQISIMTNNSVLPKKNSWTAVVHYQNTEENKNIFVVYRGIDFKNKNGRLWHTICDENGKPILIKVNDTNEQIRIMILPSSRDIENIHYSPYIPKFNSSIWWNSTLNGEYNDAHITLETDDNIQKYTNKRIALVVQNDTSFSVEYNISEGPVDDMDTLTWTPLDFSASKTAEVSLFEKREAIGTLFLKLTSISNEDYYYIIPQSIALTPCKIGEISNYKHTKTGDYRDFDEKITATFTSPHPYIKCVYAYGYHESHSDNGGGGSEHHSLSKWTEQKNTPLNLTLYYYYSKIGHTDMSGSTTYVQYILERDYGYLDNKYYFSKDTMIKTSEFTNKVTLPSFINYRNDVSTTLWENK